MINAIGNNSIANVRQNSKNVNTPSLILQPQLKNDTISFGSAKLKKEAISLLSEHASEWWVKKMQAPVFDNGANDSANMMAQLLATLSHKAEPNEKVLKFKEALKGLITKELGSESGSLYGTSLGVDYHPDNILSKALSKAGIDDNMSTLPWKTHMSINDGKIEAHSGYGAPREAVYELPDDLKKLEEAEEITSKRTGNIFQRIFKQIF